MRFNNIFRILILYVFFICILIKPVVVRTQNSIDSLHNILSNTSVSAEEKSIIYAKLAYYYQRKNPDSALFYGNKGLDIARTSSSQKGLIKNYIELGDAMFGLDSHAIALEYLGTATTYFSDYSDTIDIISVFILSGNIYYIKSDFTKAYESYLKGFKVSESEKFDGYRGRIINNIANTLEQMGEYGEALDYYHIAKSLFEKTGQNTQIGYAYNNIGMNFFRQEQLDSAYYYYKLAQNSFLIEIDSYGLSNVYNNLGRLMLEYDSLESAKKFSSLALRRGEELTGSNRNEFEKYVLANSLGLMGEIYQKEGEINRAIFFYHKMYDIAVINDIPYHISNSSLKLANNYEVQGNIDSALFYLKIHNKFNDILSNKQNDRRIAELKYEFKLEKLKQAQNLKDINYHNSQNQKDLIYLIILLSILLLFVIAILFIILQRFKMKQNRMIRSVTIKELDYKKKQLTTNLVYLNQNRILIEEVIKKLKELSTKEDGDCTKGLNDTLYILERNSNLTSWKEFEKSFQEVRPGFYIRLNKLYPSLTPNEQRLCAFLSLNMSTKEISSITLQSIESIRKARYRLRKKIQISDDQSLISHLLEL